MSTWETISLCLAGENYLKIFPIITDIKTNKISIKIKRKKSLKRDHLEINLDYFMRKQSVKNNQMQSNEILVKKS